MQLDSRVIALDNTKAIAAIHQCTSRVFLSCTLLDIGGFWIKSHKLHIWESCVRLDMGYNKVYECFFLLFISKFPCREKVLCLLIGQTVIIC